MDMRIDAAGDHDLPRGVDRSSSADCGEAARRADRGDVLARNPDIGGLRPRWKDGGTARDNDVEHLGLL